MASDKLIVQIVRKFGKRHVELAQGWGASAAVYGAVLATGIIYFTDWKPIVTKIPIYNTKFKD